MRTIGILVFALMGFIFIDKVFLTTPEEREERRERVDISMQERAERIEANRQAITSREMDIDDGLKAVLQSAITSAGFNCPAAKLAFSRGETPQGPSMMVWCGPADQEGVFEQARYLVTVLPDDRINVRPYEG